ncbi:hypothetical protein ACWFPY_17760 [Nocardia fluminea]
MSERLQLRLGGTTDDAGNAVAPGPATPITAIGVAPGASVDVLALGHDGEKVAYSVYFVPSPGQLTDEHELFVRGGWYPVRTYVWKSANGTGRTGMVAVCERGRG